MDICIECRYRGRAFSVSLNSPTDYCPFNQFEELLHRQYGIPSDAKILQRFSASGRPGLSAGDIYEIVDNNEFLRRRVLTIRVTYRDPNVTRKQTVRIYADGRDSADSILDTLRRNGIIDRDFYYCYRFRSWPTFASSLGAYPTEKYCNVCLLPEPVQLELVCELEQWQLDHRRIMNRIGKDPIRCLIDDGYGDMLQRDFVLTI